MCWDRLEMWTLLRRFHKKKSGTDGLKNRRESQPDGSESSRALTQQDDPRGRSFPGNVVAEVTETMRASQLFPCGRTEFEAGPGRTKP